MIASAFRRSGGRFMSAQEFSPKMVVLQICAIQSIFYLCFIGTTTFMAILWGFPYSLYAFFDHMQYSFKTNSKSFLVIMLWINLVGIACILPRIIERTRKCLDFVITLVFIHFIVTWIVSGFPTTGSWWTIWASGAAGCTLLGEYLCLREEQREIRLAPEDASFEEREKIGTEMAEISP
jgi:hypothetical protein